MARIVHNSLWTLAEYAWYPLLLFLATPYLLRTLGAERYGYWMLLSAVVGLGLVLTAGTGAATIKAASSSRGRGDKIATQIAIRSALGLAVGGGGFFAVGIVGTFWLAGEWLFPLLRDQQVLRMT